VEEKINALEMEFQRSEALINSLEDEKSGLEKVDRGGAEQMRETIQFNRPDSNRQLLSANDTIHWKTDD
jgi:hypothetical protein